MKQFLIILCRSQWERTPSKLNTIGMIGHWSLAWWNEPVLICLDFVAITLMIIACGWMLIRITRQHRDDRQLAKLNVQASEALANLWAHAGIASNVSLESHLEQTEAIFAERDKVAGRILARWNIK